MNIGKLTWPILTWKSAFKFCSSSRVTWCSISSKQKENKLKAHNANSDAHEMQFLEMHDFSLSVSQWDSWASEQHLGYSSPRFSWSLLQLKWFLGPKFSGRVGSTGLGGRKRWWRRRKKGEERCWLGREKIRHWAETRWRETENSLPHQVLKTLSSLSGSCALQLPSALTSAPRSI